VKRGPYNRGGVDRQPLYVKARELRETGWTLQAIGECVGVPWRTVYQWVKDIVVSETKVNRYRTPFELLVKPEAIRKRLIEERGHRCECCGLSEWLDAPIALESHHKDGNRYNNVRENLFLLCPNCHAQTDSWRGRNKGKAPIAQWQSGGPLTRAT
jgi:hypothetical protein